MAGEDAATITFLEGMNRNQAKKSIKIRDTGASGQPLVISGVQYAELFPGYSFTFALSVS